MAVAAYASLISLTQVLNNLHNRARLGNIHVDIQQIEYLQESVSYLVEALEVHSQSEDPVVKDIWGQMSETSFEAEEIFDLHVVNHLQERSDEGDESDFVAFGDDLKGVIQKVDLIKTKVSLVEEVHGDVVRVETQSMVSMPLGGSMSTSFGGENIMVGFDEHLVYVLGELKNEEKLRIIPITGMGGIGKTTLAKNVFDHQFSVDLFDVKIWFTISQEYSVEAILTGLLIDGRVERRGDNLADLGQRLYQHLFGRRYLIVMDDVWSIEAWNDFKRFFPDNGNGSRIMVTTRLENVATSLGSCDPYSLPFLNEERSWNLLCQIIFGRDDCPFPELKEIGKTIAKGCRGLPLEITVIGGLAKSNMTKEFWESITENVSSFGNSGYDEHCLKVLSLSYSNLPIHLKSCFLYLHSYPEDHCIWVSTLIKRLVAEGFIKPAEDQSLEEIAMVYINELIRRNLIFVRQCRINGEVENFGVHDLLRDLCLREFDREHFLPSAKVQSIEYQPSCFQCGEKQIHSELHNFVVISPTSSSQESPPVCGACDVMFSYRIKQRRLVRLINNSFRNHYVVHPTPVRYVLASFLDQENFIFPSLLHLLWNLQVLKISSSAYPIVFPDGIWKLPELRHLETPHGAVIPNPVDNDVEGKDFFVLKSLQTLSRIKNMKCTKDVLERVPNLKELNICYENEARDNLEWSMHLSFCNLAQLQSLQSLGIENSVLKGTIFPNSLKTLGLSECKITWEDMSTVGLLPNLERLSLYGSDEGSDWAPVEGEFLQLRFLRISVSDLAKWKADGIHFPKLEELILVDLPLLEEIPLGIGDIETLHTIALSGVSESVVESVKQIFLEQECMGNESLQLYIDGSKLLPPKLIEGEWILKPLWLDL